ncbi:transporter [Methylococcus sp. EFPC2]|uniref:transporter n=1 Tax=Methylococcus sp. EFPC2 TaxID=2812648 RepID=UPI0019687718|nr:transporter [Methylococcus sp. EFPC2]QSA96370.1 transporter [Methylococcus sp. EFPC2]
MSYNNKAYLAKFLVPFTLASICPAVHADHGGLGVGIGIASPIVTDSAITLPAGKWVVGERTQLISWDTFTNSQLHDIKHANEGTPKEDVHSIGYTLNPSVYAAYGITDTVTLGLKLPASLRYNVREAAHEEGESVNRLGNSTGFGDISAFGQWRFWFSQDNATHASLIAGLKMPTGSTRSRNSLGELFEAHFQPGSGSWDPFLGGAFTHGLGQFSFDSSVMYQFATPGTQSTNLGDGFQYNLALSYALGGVAPSVLYASSNAAGWVLVGELNGEWHAKQKAFGEYDPNTGGNTVYLSPGVRYAGGANWNISLSFGIPIVRDAYGYQDNPDYRIVNRISLLF